MKLEIPETLTSEIAVENIRQLPRERTLRWAALTAIVLLAAGLRFANLSALGYANHYYTAAVASMLKSWHNFFFVAAEPGGSVSVDKPPVGLWLQAFSAFFLGVNGFAVVLPQILAGIGSVLVIYHLVRRSFGTAAGLVAALALAITPVVIATDRNNTIDSTLILTLLLAAWAFIKAAETTKLRYLLLGAVLAGIGFNIKMLEAYLPLPAFYALYFLGASEPLRRKVGKLALSGLLLLVISFSWATVVDLTPASQRPYVGSSGNNSEMSLIFGYNGIERLLGMFGRRGGFPGGNRSSFPNSGGFFGQNGGFPQGGNNGRFRGGGGFFQGLPGGSPGLQGGNPGGFQPGIPPQQGGFPGLGTPGGRGVFANRGGFSAFDGTGRPGPLRLVIPPLSKEVSWMLPFGLLAALLLAAGSRLRWPISSEHQSLVLWGGWLLIAGVFFSVAGFFHQYYLSTMGPPLAALVGIGAVLLWRMREQRPWLGISLLVVVAVVTLGFQVVTARAFISSIGWLPLALALLAAGAFLLITGAVLVIRQNWRPASLAGFSCLMAALLLTPGVWSGLTTMYTSENQSLPAAYSGRIAGPVNSGGLQVNQALINYLQPRTQNMKFLMAVPSSMQGADYVLATGRPVLYMGGFMGQDQVIISTDLDRLVISGQLRYIYWDARSGRFGEQSDISSWIASRCTAVPGFNTAMRNSGAPDGTGSNGGFGGGFFGGRTGEMQATLYDCGNGSF